MRSIPDHDRIRSAVFDVLSVADCRPRSHPAANSWMVNVRLHDGDERVFFLPQQLTYACTDGELTRQILVSAGRDIPRRSVPIAHASHMATEYPHTLREIAAVARALVDRPFFLVESPGDDRAVIRDAFHKALADFTRGACAMLPAGVGVEYTAAFDPRPDVWAAYCARLGPLPYDEERAGELVQQAADTVRMMESHVRGVHAGWCTAADVYP